MPLDVSIIICTRNRCRNLATTLRALGTARVPGGLRCELLVVDNGSTDATAAAVSSHRPHAFPTQLLSVPEPGLCRARNAGIERARGRVILFTDDDVAVPGEWISAIAGPVLEGEADAVAGGVDFDPERREAIARLGLESYAGWWASTKHLNPERPERMVGANMAFSKELFSAVGPFDINLGPGGTGFADETLFSLQLLKAGFRLAGRLETAVTHLFDLDRLEPAAILSTANRMGRSRAYLFHHWYGDRSRLAAFHLLWQALRRRLIGTGCLGDPASPKFQQLMRATERSAFCREYLKQRGLPPRYLDRSRAVATHHGRGVTARH